MACHYFEKEYFGVCTASESNHVPSIAEMEKYCFKEYYRHCPIFEDFTVKRSQSERIKMNDFAYLNHHQEEKEGKTPKAFGSF
jgi:hypothetical protein